MAKSLGFLIRVIRYVFHDILDAAIQNGTQLINRVYFYILIVPQAIQLRSVDTVMCV